MEKLNFSSSFFFLARNATKYLIVELENINPDDKNIFKSFRIKEILKIYCSLPILNAEGERRFSSVNRIKTYSRNRPLTGALEDLMMINLNGDDF